MTDALLEHRIQQLPKVELHVHLEGATDAETVWELAERNGISLPAPTLEQWKEHYRFRDFEHFIEVYTASTAVMKTSDDWRLMVDRFLERQARQNVVYSEVFLSASHQVGHVPLDDWIEALIQGAVEGEARHGVTIRFIPDISRHHPETQEEVLQCAIRAARSEYFIGLGLGGIESGFPASLFKETFERAHRAGLHVVAHAGETTGARTIWDAIELLKAERIGHGIRCLEDLELVSELRATQIPIEVCPKSNYCLGVVQPGTPHPIRRMVDAGLNCSINSDDPPMFETSLNDEFQLLTKQGFSWQELVHLNNQAVESSFLSRDQKSELRGRIDAGAD